MNTLINKITWLTVKDKEVLDAANLVEEYFKIENLKFRNIVDGLQTMLIERKLSVRTIKAIRKAIFTETEYSHSMYKNLESFVKNKDLSRQEMANAITLAIHYFKNEEHTKILRHLYATILK